MNWDGSVVSIHPCQKYTLYHDSFGGRLGDPARSFGYSYGALWAIGVATLVVLVGIWSAWRDGRGGQLGPVVYGLTGKVGSLITG